MLNHCDEMNDAVARFLAAGGTIKKLPPCCLALEGAVRREDLVAEEDAPTPRERIRRAVGNEIARYRSIKAVQNAEHERASRDRARDTIAAKLKNESVQKLGRILRAINGEWTGAKLREVAAMEKVLPGSLRDFLRRHGHGNNLPAQDRRKAAQPVYTKPKVDTTERDAEIVSDFLAWMSLNDIAEKHRVGKATIRKIVDSAGVQRPQSDKAVSISRRNAGICSDYAASVSVEEISTKYGVTVRNIVKIAKDAGLPLLKHLKESAKTERDAAVRADYEALMPLPDIAAKYGVAHSTVFDIVKRAGGKIHKPWRKNNGQPERDKQIAAAYASGKSMPQISREMGIPYSTVHWALHNAGVKPRDKSTACTMAIQGRLNLEAAQ
jgi:Mor family transcriptional regulator